MTREEARYYLQSSGFSEEQTNTIEQAFMGEPCGDYISRQAVLKLFATHDGKYLYEAIRDMSSVQQEPKIGKWIYDNSIGNWKCSECGEPPRTYGYVGSPKSMKEHFKYCNHCGCRMESE